MRNTSSIFCFISKMLAGTLVMMLVRGFWGQGIMLGAFALGKVWNGEGLATDLANHSKLYFAPCFLTDTFPDWELTREGNRSLVTYPFPPLEGSESLFC